MRYTMISLSALMLASAATPAFADDTAPPPALTVTGGATVVTDYRFRGVSQTNRKVALQGTFTVTHSSGFYVSTWGSTIDDYIAAGSDQELDLIAGYSHTFGNGIKLDGGAAAARLRHPAGIEQQAVGHVHHRPGERRQRTSRLELRHGPPENVDQRPGCATVRPQLREAGGGIADRPDEPQ